MGNQTKDEIHPTGTLNICIEVLESGEEYLLKKLIAYTSNETEYSKYINNMEDRWRHVLREFIKLMEEYLESDDNQNPIAFEKRFKSNPFFTFDILDTTDRRENDVTPDVFIVLCKLVRQAFIDIIHESGIKGAYKIRALNSIHHFWDCFELSNLRETARPGTGLPGRARSGPTPPGCEQENTYFAFFQGASEPGYVIDGQMRLQAVNPAFEDFFDVKQSDVTGKPCYEVVRCGSMKQHCPLRESMSKQTFFSGVEIDVQSKSGPVAVLFNGSFLRDTDNKVIRAIGILQDIPDYKGLIAEQEKNEKELFFRNRIAEIFLTVPDDEMYGEVLNVLLEAMESEHGIFGYIDDNGDLVIPSLIRGILTQCQISDKRVVFPRQTWGKTIWSNSIMMKKILHSNEPLTKYPDGHTPIRRAISMPVIHQDEVIGLIIIANKDSDYIDYDIQLFETFGRVIAPILDARLEKQREEKARKRTEQLLKESETKYRTLFESSAEGIAVADIETKQFVYTNPAFQQMLGYTEEELESLGVADIHPEESLEYVLSEFDSQARHEKCLIHNIPILRKDGVLIYTNINTTPMILNERRCNVGFFTDVTEKKKAEENRQRIEMEINQNRKLEAVGSLAAGIAHEINTPIQFIGDNVRFLADSFESLISLTESYDQFCHRAGSGEDPNILSVEKADIEKAFDLDYIKNEIPAAIEQTLDGVKRVTKIVQAMKDFAHSDRGKATRNDVNKMLESTLTVARNELKYVADVETNFNPEMPEIECYRDDLNQVFLNLLINAAHAIADMVGDGSTGKGTITVTTGHDDTHVTIIISDTGTGIPESIRDRIFDPFFTTKDVGKGSGQGLSMARSIVADKHKGKLSFETEEGNGTRFIVRLPINLQEAAVVS